MRYDENTDIAVEEFFDEEWRHEGGHTGVELGPRGVLSTALVAIGCRHQL